MIRLALAGLLSLAVVCPQSRIGLDVGGISLGRVMTLGSLRALSADARCNRGKAGWSICRLSYRFIGIRTAARVFLQADGIVHSLEFELPLGEVGRAKAEFARQFGSSLEMPKDSIMLFFAVRQQTALGVFKSTNGRVTVTYTWLEGAWRGPRTKENASRQKPGENEGEGRSPECTFSVLPNSRAGEFCAASRRSRVGLEEDRRAIGLQQRNVGQRPGGGP